MRDEETGRCTCRGRLTECACTGEPGCHPTPSPVPILMAMVAATQQVAIKASRFRR